MKDDASIKRYCRRNNTNSNTSESCTTGPTSLTRALQSGDDDKVTSPLRSYIDTSKVNKIVGEGFVIIFVCDRSTGRYSAGT